MSQQLINLLIETGAHPEQAISLTDQESPWVHNARIQLGEQEQNALFAQNRNDLLAVLGMDTLIAQATLVLEDEDIEEDVDEDEGAIKNYF